MSPASPDVEILATVQPVPTISVVVEPPTVTIIAAAAAGRQGIPGTAAFKGDPGPQGPPGAPGTPGAKGDKGDTGAPGAEGSPGQPGPTGPPGVQGITGVKGDTGPTGPIGPQGQPGVDSTVPGPKGDKGDVGTPGTPGAQGIQGPTGPAGPPGTQGEPGPRGYTGQDSTVPGPPGPQGPTIFTYDGVPTADFGNEGEFSLDTNTGILYGPKNEIALGPPQSMQPSYTTGNDAGTANQINHTMGTDFSVTADGVISALRFWRCTDSALTSRTAKLWRRSDLSLLATSQPSSESGGQTGWVSVPLATPLTVSAGDEFVVSYQSDVYRGQVGRPPNESDDMVWMFGRYSYGYPPGAAPAGGGSDNYFADATFRAYGEIWPVAMESGPGPEGPPGPEGSQGPPGTSGIGADSGGAADQIGVWSDADTITGSTDIIQNPNGSVTVQRDTIGDRNADFHGLQGQTGRMLFGPDAMFIATLVAGGQITLVPGNNNYGGQVVVNENGVFVQLQIAVGRDPTAAMEVATKQYVDSRPSWVQLTQTEYDALSPPDPATLYVIVG